MHALLVATLVALLLLSGAVLVFLFRQVSMVQKELDAATALVEDYQTKRGPLITNLVTRLQGFAQTHPDFNPILERYGIGPALGTQPQKPSAPSELRK